MIERLSELPDFLNVEHILKKLPTTNVPREVWHADIGYVVRSTIGEVHQVSYIAEARGVHPYNFFLNKDAEVVSRFGASTFSPHFSMYGTIRTDYQFAVADFSVPRRLIIKSLKSAGIQWSTAEEEKALLDDFINAAMYSVDSPFLPTISEYLVSTGKYTTSGIVWIN